MRKISRYKSQASVLIILSLLITVVISRLGISSVLDDRKDLKSIELSKSFNSSNAEVSYRLARIYQMLMIGDEDQVQDLYINSLQHNPLHSPSWLGLAELYSESGEEDKARITLRRAFELIPSSIGLLWESSLLAISLGDLDLALDKLRVVAQADPQRRKRVFDLCGQIVSDPNLILQRVVTDEILGDYLNYLISTDKQRETYPVWVRLKASGEATPESILKYVDYLLRKGDSGGAKRIWAGLYPDSKNNSLVWNGSFEMDSVGRGLDWRIGKPEGADIEFDYENKTRGDRSVKITFSGKNNIDFHHLSQSVPVDPDSNYLLTLDISTRDITTRNGVRWQIYCEGMNEFSETYTGTIDWVTAHISFVTPHDCNVVHIRPRRIRSRRLDNLISGEVWIDNVNLFKLSGATDA
jgi:hypothetical protein